MDLVYICRAGENEELRYSIRSAEKNLKFDNLWIVGDAPDWYTGNLIKVDPVGTKYIVARKNLKTLANSDQISEDFILMNDDFFIMQPMDTVSIWHGGRLDEKIKYRKVIASNSSYTNLLSETYTVLRRQGHRSALDYELHTPLPMTREGLRNVLGYGGLWRSLYGNLSGIGGEQHEDVKLYHPASILYKEIKDIETTPYLSSDDASFAILSYELNKRFPEPSSYESI